MKNNGYLHIRTPACTYDMDWSSNVGHHGGVTVAYDWNPVLNELHLAYSVCSKKDLFCKRKGRLNSILRLGNADYGLKNPEYFKIIDLPNTKEIHFAELWNEAISNLPKICDKLKLKIGGNEE